jgi:hypothetical protein
VGALREALQQAGAREALAQVTPLISGVPIVLLPCRKAQLALAPDDPVLQQVSRRASPAGSLHLLLLQQPVPFSSEAVLLFGAAGGAELMPQSRCS